LAIVNAGLKFHEQVKHHHLSANGNPIYDIRLFALEIRQNEGAGNLLQPFFVYFLHPFPVDERPEQLDHDHLAGQ